MGPAGIRGFGDDLGVAMLRQQRKVIKGQVLDRPSGGRVPAPRRRGRPRGKGSRAGWAVAGILAAAVTLLVALRAALDRTEDPQAKHTPEKSAMPARLSARESM